MKKVLVTGGAGFIGSHTSVELYNAGYLPVLLDNFANSDKRVLKGIEAITGHTPICHEGDCTDYTFVDRIFREEGPFEGVIHFAAYKAVNESVHHPLKYYHNNLQSTEVLLTAMQKHGCSRLVFSSSCTVYGQPASLPVTEETPFQRANSPYGFTKQVCERMISDVASASVTGLQAVLLRYFNPIGAHPSGHIGELPLGKPENLVPYITQTAAGLRDEVVIFGNDYDTPDGTCVRDYIHVVDLAEAHVAALRYLEHPSRNCEALNLGTGEGNSVSEVVKSFIEETGAHLPYRFGERRPGDVEQIWASAAKAADLLKWHTKRDLREALRDAWNWQQKIS